MGVERSRFSYKETKNLVGIVALYLCFILGGKAMVTDEVSA